MKFFDRRFEKLTYFQGYSLYKSIEAAWTLGTNIEFWLHRYWILKMLLWSETEDEDGC